MEAAEIQQACLDLSNAALAIFDVVDMHGISAPMDTIDSVLKLKTMVDNTEKIRRYYFQANLHRMMALGVNPVQILRALDDNDKEKLLRGEPI